MDSIGSIPPTHTLELRIGSTADLKICIATHVFKWTLLVFWWGHQNCENSLKIAPWSALAKMQVMAEPESFKFFCHK